MNEYVFDTFWQYGRTYNLELISGSVRHYKTDDRKLALLLKMLYKYESWGNWPIQDGVDRYWFEKLL